LNCESSTDPRRHCGRRELTEGRGWGLANQAAGPPARKALEDLMPPRDKITAELAEGDPGVIGDLQDVFAGTRRATLPAGEQ
jgi:hypothetical protein